MANHQPSLHNERLNLTRRPRPKFPPILCRESEAHDKYFQTPAPKPFFLPRLSFSLFYPLESNRKSKIKSANFLSPKFSNSRHCSFFLPSFELGFSPSLSSPPLFLSLGFWRKREKGDGMGGRDRRPRRGFGGAPHQRVHRQGRRLPARPWGVPRSFQILQPSLFIAS